MASSAIEAQCLGPKSAWVEKARQYTPHALAPEAPGSVGTQTREEAGSSLIRLANYITDRLSRGTRPHFAPNRPRRPTIYRLDFAAKRAHPLSPPIPNSIRAAPSYHLLSVKQRDTMNILKALIARFSKMRRGAQTTRPKSDTRLLTGSDSHDRHQIAPPVAALSSSPIRERAGHPLLVILSVAKDPCHWIFHPSNSTNS